jgi:hypothetical protein
MKRLPYWFLLAAVTVGAGHAAIADWLEDVAKQPTPEFKNAPPALVLLDETVCEIDEHGQADFTHRYAIRILHLGARNLAVGSVRYNGEVDKVSHAEACVWRAGEVFKKFRQGDWVDLADNAEGAVVDEMRKKTVDCSSSTVVGDVFASETRVKGPLLFAMVGYDFDNMLPVLVERWTLTAPPGFQISSKVFGAHPPGESRSANGRTCVWTARDRPYRREEPLPGRGAYLDAEVFASIEPPAGRLGCPLKQFGTWGELAAWAEQLNADSYDTSPALAAKTRELVAGSADPLSKIRAIATYVQATRYVAINRDLSKGIGFKARKASVVFSTGFGDCKDKANLMCAMLREAGIHASMVSARAGSDLDVQPECPTPNQFDHAIVGIEVGPDIALPSVVQAGKLGRLLLFDPTHEFVQVGDLPPQLQGVRVLVCSRDAEGLVDTPEIGPEVGFGLERSAEITLLPKGVAQISAKVTASGFPGAFIRRQFKEADTPRKLEALANEHLSDTFKGALIGEKTVEDDRTGGRIMLSFTCANKGLVQPLPGGLAVVKLDVMDRREMPAFPEKDRSVPVRLYPLAVVDMITLHIPAGCKIDELPPNAAIESPFGRYQITTETAGETVVVRRAVNLNRMEVPAADYAKLKTFLGQIAKADRCSVILKSGG